MPAEIVFAIARGRANAARVEFGAHLVERRLRPFATARQNITLNRRVRDRAAAVKLLAAAKLFSFALARMMASVSLMVVIHLSERFMMIRSITEKAKEKVDRNQAEPILSPRKLDFQSLTA